MAVNKKKEALGRQRDKTSAELEDPLGFAVSPSSIFSMYSPGTSQTCDSTSSGMDTAPRSMIPRRGPAL